MPSSTQAPGFSDYDLYLLGEGRHYHAYEKMGAHSAEVDGQRGIHFAVWAPNAREVSVVGDFNRWNQRFECPRIAWGRPGHGRALYPMWRRARCTSITSHPNTGDKFAIMPIAVYQRTKVGDPQHPWNHCLAFSARPQVFFTKYLSLALEGGFDHTDSPGQYEGWLRKFTIAPQIGAGRKFESRPVLRVFLTYADFFVYRQVASC